MKFSNLTQLTRKAKLTNIQLKIRDANAVVGSLDSTYNEVKFKKYYNLKDQTLLSLQNICFKKLQIHYTETNFKMLKQGSCLKMQLQNCYPKPYFRLDVGWGYDQSKQSMDDQRHKTTTIIEYKAQNISQTATLL